MSEDVEDPVRWSAGAGPPGTADFLARIERPVAMPPALRTSARGRLSRSVAPPSPRWLARAALAVAVVIGGVVVWVMQRPVTPEVAITPVDEIGLVVDETPDLAATETERDVLSEAGTDRRDEAPDTERPRAPTPPRARGPEDEAPLASDTGGPGWLLINSTPWSRVTIDGVDRGTTPIVRLELAAGAHRVHLESSEGSADFSVTIVAAETLRVRRDLRGSEAPSEGALDPWGGPPIPVPPSGGEGEVTDPFEGRRGEAPRAPSPAPSLDLSADDDGSEWRAMPYDVARAAAIAGNHREVIRILDGHAHTLEDYELLIESLRATPGMRSSVERNMREYLALWPSGPRVSVYETYLATDGE